MSERVTALGIPCPWDGAGESPGWRYAAWFWLYKTTRQVRHRFGIHDRQKHYSIAPRCDWCGYRSPKQQEVARRNHELMSQPDGPDGSPKQDARRDRRVG